MYFTPEIIFGLTKRDENLNKSSELCETMQIWRKSLSFQLHDQGPRSTFTLSEQGGAWLRQPSGAGSHIPQGVLGPPHTFSFISRLEIWL